MEGFFFGKYKMDFTEPKKIHLENNQGLFLAGSDEVGRGCLAGPVVAATVIFTSSQNKMPELFNILKGLGVTDSKKITRSKRRSILSKLDISFDSLQQNIKYNNNEFSFSLCQQSPKEIDKINILQASLLSMKNSFKLCWDKKSKGIWMIDGNKVPDFDELLVNKKSVIKGDTKSLLIGLASVIAKEYRDNLMEKLGNIYPGYGIEQNAGYPTKLHKDAIKVLGVTPIHRLSFRGVKEYIIPSERLY